MPETKMDIERARRDPAYFFKHIGNVELQPYQKEILKAMKQEEKEFWGHCGDCKHEWKVCDLPMPIEKFTAICGNQTCAKCHSRNIKIGKVPYVEGTK